jgi:hypothetical protein
MSDKIPSRGFQGAVLNQRGYTLVDPNPEPTPSTSNSSCTTVSPRGGRKTRGPATPTR